ncbi:RNA polymerase sigma factor [Gemmatimonas sp.]|uniref:RNA polymerase sigma factor n=1 Tax=Gemmatimonas sp. TaxID=1962908 RepID=UPI0037C07FE9
MSEDRALLRDAAAGDARAFEQFMTAHQAAVHRFLVTSTADGVDLDDALQETFIAAWRGAASFTGDATARAWLYGIARNVVRHQLRKRVGEPAHEDSLEQLAEQAGWGCADPADTFGEATIAHDLLSVAMARLPQEEREILTLRELDGFTGDETAQLLKLSRPAMKSRLHRARIHLAAIVRVLDGPRHATAPGSRP